MKELTIGAAVELSLQEIMAAVLVGAMRQALAIKRKATGQAEQPENMQWQHGIEGALGECAFAKLAGLYWGNEGFRFRADGDVAGIEIKTHWFKGDSLAMIIRPCDVKDARQYVLMNGVNGVYTYRGWSYGRDCKKEEWLNTAGPGDTRPACFWVPVAELHGTPL